MLIIQGLIALSAAVAVMRISFNHFYEDSDHAIESVGHALTPPITSLFDGEFIKNAIESRRFSLWISIGLTTWGVTFVGLGILRAIFDI